MNVCVVSPYWGQNMNILIHYPVSCVYLHSNVRPSLCTVWTTAYLTLPWLSCSTQGSFTMTAPRSLAVCQWRGVGISLQIKELNNSVSEDGSLKPSSGWRQNISLFMLWWFCIFGATQQSTERVHPDLDWGKEFKWGAKHQSCTVTPLPCLSLFQHTLGGR